MDLGIKDRVAVVAASSRGLGRAVAEALAAEGVKLALCARDAQPLAKTAEEIRGRFGVDVFEQALDVTDENGVKGFVAAARERLGGVDICVTNAGGPPGGHFDDFSPADWRGAFELNFMSALYFIKEVLPEMKARRWGRIVTITSSSVRQPIDGLILSNSVRPGLAGLMKSLASECGPANVLLNNVCPGRFKTGRSISMTKKRAESLGVSVEEVLDRSAQQIPLKRLGEPEEFGAMVAFLCSEKASYVTGGSFLIDGGLVSGI